MTHRPRTNTAFTLVELMISIFMVVLLMVGINMVFKLASDTVGMGQQAIALSRDNRSVQSIMQDDAGKWMRNAPAFYIVNELVQDPKSFNLYHRRDYFAFPTYGVFHRQTGFNNNSYVSTTASYEAWVWYGSTFPVMVGQNPLTTTPPTDVVGRFALLMKDPASILGNENFIQRQNNLLLSPLNWASHSVLNSSQLLWQSQVDLAGASFAQVRQDISLVRPTPDNGTSPSSNAQTVDWWVPLIFRYQCNNKLPKPMTPSAVAQATPFLAGNCSEFIVEFAGDYFTQDNSGKVTDKNNVDGETDFDVFGQYRQIHWYGMFRDTNNDAAPPNPLGVSQTTPAVKQGIGDNGDVTPAYFMAGQNALPAVRSNNIYFERPPLRNNNQYIAVWANDAPRLIRITMKLEDPSGRIQDGQWVQFVIGPQ